MLKNKKHKAHHPPHEIPSDARFSLRAAFVLTTIVAVVFAIVGPAVRAFAANKTQGVFAVWALLLGELSAVVVAQGWLRRHAERQCGPPRLILLPANYSPFVSADVAALLTGAFHMGVILTLIGFLGAAAAEIPLGAALFGTFFLTAEFSGTAATNSPALLWWRGRVRLSERGIVTGSRFLEWQHCYRYELPTERPNVVVTYWNLKTSQAVFAGFRNGPRGQGPTTLDLHVLPEERVQLEKMLEHHVRHGAAWH